MSDMLSAAFVTVFIASVIDTERSYIVPGTRARAAQDDIAAAIVAIGKPVVCVDE